MLTDLERLAVLTEEVGEVAHALNENDPDELRRELLQVAACAVAWLERIEDAPQAPIDVPDEQRAALTQSRYALPPRVTAKEIAAVAGTVLETVLIAHRRGELESGVRVGRALTFDASDAVRWLHAKGVHNVVAVSRDVRGA